MNLNHNIILSILRKLLRLLKPKLFSTELVVVKKKTDVNSFLTIYIRNKASKFIGSTSKQNNKQQPNSNTFYATYLDL
jgi:hypothetical protein